MADRSIISALLVLIMSAVGLAPATAAQDRSIEMRVLPTGRFTEDGSLVARVLVRCDVAEGSVLEALATATQDEAFAQTGLSGVTCDGRSQLRRIVFTPFDGSSFQRGHASMSVFMLILQNETTGETLSGGDARSVRVVGPGPG